MKHTAALFLLFSILIWPLSMAYAQPVQVFEKIEMYEPDGKSVRETDVRVRFDADALEITSARSGGTLKRWAYADISAAEYSYTKNPRWKTGLGLGAAGFLFPPLWLVAIPLGFTKHRRHWLTIRTGDDYALLKLSKSNRKLFVPAFETRTNVRIAALGDDK